MVNQLTVPLPLFRALLTQLAGPGSAPVLMRVGWRRDADVNELLGRDVVPMNVAGSSEPVLIVTSEGTSADLEAGLGSTNAYGWLVLPANPRTRVSGQLRQAGEIRRLDLLRVIGPGMYQFPLSDNAGAQPAVPDLGFPTPSHEYWSRTIGALGGAHGWRRLTSLRIAVIGCGRSGSLAASMLTRMGTRHITLVDPDRVEFHNCGEMDLVDQSDVGRLKVEAVGERILKIRAPAPCHLRTIAESLNEPVALRELKRADVLVVTVDSDAARLGTALLATLYHKVLIDIGTGVLATPKIHVRENRDIQKDVSPSATMGADIRLILPGHRCLLCTGGLTNYPQAVADLTSRHATRSTVRLDTMRRTGSLRSLNQMAVAAGLRMLEDLVTARVESSTWLRLEYDSHGRITSDYREPPATRPCSLCYAAGRGDDGLVSGSADMFSRRPGGSPEFS